jgi:hypothetical protein
MATLHKEFNGFNSDIRLNQSRIDSLNKSKNSIKNRIREWFEKNKSDELQPKFGAQGSFMMGTSVNPIPTYDGNGNKLLKYDLDYGVYFIAKNDEDVKKKQTITTWHNWVFDSVDDHTNRDSIDKNTCVRVVFADGHHIDLPIYYKKDDLLQLAHKGKDWIDSDPKAFYVWFNNNKTAQLERIVRYFKAWKNFREDNNNTLKLPSGFEFTILATNNFQSDDMDDVAFRETVRNIYLELSKPGGFKCLRPTAPVNEDVFSSYSDKRRNDFLNTLKSLLDDLDRAKNEKNFKKASEILINHQFGSRFPTGEDKSEDVKSSEIAKSLSSTLITPKPYGS